MKNILLVEPGYKNKYPPLGLMKISTYHKNRKDNVVFVKGIDKTVHYHIWDRVYITTLFTFDFDISIEAINYYKSCVTSCSDIFVGGIMASLLKDKVIQATGLPEKNILVGLLHSSSVLGDRTRVNIDALSPDYDILEMVDYKYPIGDNYIAYTTRGCPNKCPFCAVPQLEPEFAETKNIKAQLQKIDDKYGPKKNLLLLDNNILNAPNLSKIVQDLCNAGFAKKSRFVDPGQYEIILRRYHRGERNEYLNKKLKNYLSDFKKRIPRGSSRDLFLEFMLDAETCDDYVEYILSTENQIKPLINKYKNMIPKARYIDFNQGIDARRINEKTMKLLSQLSIRPLRIAFDNMNLLKIYKKAVRLAYKYGIKEISNYILFNYDDKPEDLYNRLECNIELNEELGINIFSFPMRYSPIERTDRTYVGKYWSKKYLSAISAILHVTNGVVAAGSSFFKKAFGASLDEFFSILAMPRDMIMYRFYYEETGQIQDWQKLFNALNDAEKLKLFTLISCDLKELRHTAWPTALAKILPFYFLKKKALSQGALPIPISRQLSDYTLFEV